ncbi:MAG: DNA-binding protein, partial [Limisphaerales bacterium]
VQISAQKSGGGDFYRTQRTRSGERFAKALIESTLEGRTPYRDAMRLLGMTKVETFNRFARELEFVV